MRSESLSITIDELVLDGVSPQDRERILAALDRELAARLELADAPRRRLAQTITETIARSDA